jgi:hypothetical protein
MLPVKLSWVVVGYSLMVIGFQASDFDGLAKSLFTGHCEERSGCEAEPIPGSDKLLRLTVDIGEVRAIVAGVAAHYKIDKLKNKQVIVLANLKPVKLMGVESQGMILAAEDKGGVYLLRPDKKSKPGSPIT